MKIKDYLTDAKTWILLILFFIGIGTAFAGILNLPKRVEKVEGKVEVATSSVQTLAANLDKYIAINEAQRTAQDKREQLIIELINKK